MRVHPPGENPESLLQYASWGPTGSQLIFVSNNRIFYQDSAKSSPYEIKSQLTSNTPVGPFSTIMKGIPDWLYEEEIIASDNAIWFSPDGSKVLYAMYVS